MGQRIRFPSRCLFEQLQKLLAKGVSERPAIFLKRRVGALCSET